MEGLNFKEVAIACQHLKHTVQSSRVHCACVSVCARAQPCQFWVLAKYVQNRTDKELMFFVGQVYTCGTTRVRYLRFCACYHLNGCREVGVVVAGGEGGSDDNTTEVQVRHRKEIGESREGSCELLG